jgi:hypothetical protein
MLLKTMLSTLSADDTFSSLPFGKVSMWKFFRDNAKNKVVSFLKKGESLLFDTPITHTE